MTRLHHACEPSAPKSVELLPIGLSISFVTLTQALSLSAFLPLPVAVAAGLAWGTLIATTATWLARRPRIGGCGEDVLIAIGSTAMAVLAFGGGVGILLLNTALDSPSLTGQMLVQLFLPSIPIAILSNAPMELLVIPALLVLAWRPGRRRILVLAATVLFGAHRIWTHLVFAPDRLDFATMEQSADTLSSGEREQVLEALHLDDPRWILNLVIFAVFLLAAFHSRHRKS
ncbi:hypothetical protein FB566_5029 [Stackebrandtia endophytica]|uniref:Uncharacterized protein n=1 Tax=Stackebrandtia endophytica TaxID=1496996 RepID=A0A543B3L9_9ACTN|nr:hypothetical protein [Stackebrandtia endophytica]TQL79424.1 hypothetical protein FB566_5029 [Stackebrandtia endophytica]